MHIVQDVQLHLQLKNGDVKQNRNKTKDVLKALTANCGTYSPNSDNISPAGRLILHAKLSYRNYHKVYAV